jgi:signal transduction histidine kinase
LAHRGVRLELALAPQLPQLIVDAARIKQLLWNLLVNAVDELSDGGLIRLGTVAQSDHVLLTVEDSGLGIPEERRASLFTASTSRKSGGFGLGLALCKEIVELHGGCIELGDSELGGAKFSIHLPLMPA